MGPAKKASGGKVCHLESRLRMRFTPRSSGQITSAFESGATRYHFLRHVYQTVQTFAPRQGCRRHQLNRYKKELVVEVSPLPPLKTEVAAPGIKQRFG